jgi:hypothetical protein
MISRKTIERATKQFKALREQEPSLSSEDAQAILIAASNDAVAQALFSLGTSIEQTGGIKLSVADPVPFGSGFGPAPSEASEEDAMRILHELKRSWDASPED